MDIRTILDLRIFSDKGTIDNGITYAKDLLSQHVPYTKKYTLSGDNVVYVFPKHFTEGVILAFNTDNMSHLSKQERDFLLLFIAWQNFLLADPENPILPGSIEDTFVSSKKAQLKDFNDWLVDELSNTTHPIV